MCRWWWLAGMLACGDPAPPPDEQLPEILSGAKDTQGQLLLLEQYVAQHPDSAKGHVLLARAYRDVDHDRAERTYERAITLGPADAIPRVELGWLVLEPSLRRGVTPPREDLERAEKLVHEGFELDRSCENRHHLIGVYGLEAEAGFVAEGAETFLAESFEACGDAAFRPGWSATAGRLHRLQGKAAVARDELCEAVKLGNAAAIDECFELASPAEACSAVQGGANAHTEQGGRDPYGDAADAHDCR